MFPDLADGGAPALERIRADARRLEVLNEIARVATEGGELAATLQAVVETLARKFDWEFVACVSVDLERGMFVCEAVTSRWPTVVTRGYTRPLGSGVVGEVAATGRPILLDDVRTSENYVETLEGTLSELCVPVIYRGELVALLNLESTRLAAFHDQLPLLETVARQVAGAIHLARANRDLLEANRRLEEAQQRIAQLMTSSTGGDVGAWAQALSADLARTLGAEEIEVWELDRGRARSLAARRRSPPDFDALGAVARGSVLNTPEGDLVLPATGWTGELCGAVVARGLSRPQGETERRLLAGFAHQVAGALEMRRMQARLAAAEVERAPAREKIHAGGTDTLAVCATCGRCFSHEVERCPEDATALDTSRLLPLVLQGRYVFQRYLGQGGMGTVYLAKDQKLGREVAIKVVRPEHFGNQETRQRFEREAQAVARVQHPGVVALYDTGELPDGSEYLVLERLRGQGLGDLLARHGPGTPAQVAELVRQAAAALAAAHRAGVVHRDVKPDNVFLCPAEGSFQVKLLDFGLAKSFAHESGLTLSGTIVGTPAYMPPEQVQGLPVDARSDLYSLAAVAYEALSGHPAVGGSDVARTLANVLDVRPVPISTLVPGLPPGVEAAFDWALAKRPDERPGWIEGWADELARRLVRMTPGVPGWRLGA